MQSRFGRRGGLSHLDIGVRKVAPTFGKTCNFVGNGLVALEHCFVVEGEAEQAVAQAFGFDPSTVKIDPQPFVVDVTGGRVLYTPDEIKSAKERYKGCKHSLYVPDFVTEHAGHLLKAWEVKLDSYLGDDLYAAKLERAKEILIGRGIAFSRVIIPSSQRHPLWANIALISQGHARRDLWPDATVLNCIAQAAKNGATTAADYLAQLNIDMRTIPVYIASGALSMDLISGPIRASAPVQPAYGDLRHLQLLERLAQ